MAFDFDANSWESIATGEAEMTDVSALGTIDPGEDDERRVQWGRGDTLPLLGATPIGDTLFEVGGGRFPPFTEDAIRFESYSLGPIRFTDVLELQADNPAEQGRFVSRADLGALEFSGVYRNELLNLSIPFSATTDIPSITAEIGGVSVTLPVPEACLLFLDAGRADAHVRLIPMEIHTSTVPAVDARFLATASAALQTDDAIAGVTTATRSAPVPLCIESAAANADLLDTTLIASNLFTFVVERQARRLVATIFRLEPEGQPDVDTSAILDDLAGPVFVDAFTRADYEALRTRTYAPVRTAIECPRDEPEWIHLHPDGTTLATRRTFVDNPFGCIAIGPE